MGRLQENELTKLLIDTFDEFRDCGLLEKFLEKVSIKLNSEEIKKSKFDNFTFFQLDENQRREIDGIIQLKSTLIFIESKRGNNKFDKSQLLNEFSIGSKIANKQKLNFYLIAIDEHVIEPSIIETIRNSSYAQIKKDQIKWISWYEITDIFSQIFEKFQFEGKHDKYIFEKRLKKYQEQGFKGFEGFNKKELAILSKTDDFVSSIISINNEIGNFIKSLQIELFPEHIIRLYKLTEHKRVINKKRRKIKNKVYHIFWEQKSFGIGHKVGNIPFSYSFPFADNKWKSDLTKETPDYYLYVTFDYMNKCTKVGYRINKQKNIKEIFSNENKTLLAIQKNRTYQRRSMFVEFKKVSLEIMDSKDLILSHIKEFKKSTRIDLFFEYPMLDVGLFNKIKDSLLFLRSVINKHHLMPVYSETEKVNIPESNEVFIDGEILEDDI